LWVFTIIFIDLSTGASAYEEKRKIEESGEENGF